MFAHSSARRLSASMCPFLSSLTKRMRSQSSCATSRRALSRCVLSCTSAMNSAYTSAASLGKTSDICSSFATGDGNSPSRNASLSMRTIPTSASTRICSMRVLWSKNVMVLRRNTSRVSFPARYSATITSRSTAAFAAAIARNTSYSSRYSVAVSNPNRNERFTSAVKPKCFSSVCSSTAVSTSPISDSSASAAAAIFAINLESCGRRRVAASVSANRETADSISDWNVSAGGEKARVWSGPISSLSSKLGAVGNKGAYALSSSSFFRYSFSRIVSRTSS
mmetsp:Transcript_11621/g.49601  ORF Transcript_11621/g.49601 Transcript_11621/m.49601 type:complete len:280 (+) Transcript_11621:2251-3090(+)